MSFLLESGYICLTDISEAAYLVLRGETLVAVEDNKYADSPEPAFIFKEASSVNLHRQSYDLGVAFGNPKKYAEIIWDLFVRGKKMVLADRDE